MNPTPENVALRIALAAHALSALSLSRVSSPMRGAVPVLAAFALLVPAARADVVVLSNGDTLRGEVTARDEQTVTLSHPDLGELELPADRVASVTVGEGEAAAQAEASGEAADGAEEEAAGQAEASGEASLAAEPEKPGLFGTSFLAGWNREFELGVTGEAGVKDSLDVMARVNADYEDRRHRWLFDAEYYYATEEGEATDSEFSTKLRHDWLMPDDPWFYFGEGSYAFDDFEEWEHRLRAGGGAGYTFLDSDEFDLRGRVGASVLGEFGGTQDDDVVPEGLVGAEFAWRFTEGQRIEAFNTFYPQLEDVGEFRNVTGVEYVAEIDRHDGLSFKLGAENEHDSTDAEKNDFRYYVTVVLGI